MTSRTQSPTSALIAHVEHLVASSRILVIGSAQNVVPSHLLSRGARLVQVLDPDARAVALAAAHNTERRISYAQLTETSLRDASFDCAIVEDLALSSDPERLLLGVRRSIGPRGIALICSSSAERTSGLLGVSSSEIGFDELEELTSSIFDDVMMLGQAPFVGYSVVSLSLDSPPEPCLDNEFLSDSESADRFIAICGSEEALAEVDLEDMTIVQLPAGRVLADGESLHRERERRAQRRIEALEMELEKVRRRSSPSEVETLTRQLEERDSWIRDLEARAANAEARVDDLEAEQERLEAELSKDKSSIDQSEAITALREELESMRRTAARSQKETRWAEERVRKVERELEVALAEIDAADTEAKDAGFEAERAKAEEKISALDARIRKLEQELTEQRASTEARERELEASEQEVEETHAALLQSAEALRETKRSLAKAQEQAARAEAELAKRESSREASVSRDAISSDSISRDPVSLDGVELERLEAQLKERGGRVQELEEQLRKLELFSKSLASELSLAAGRTQLEQLEGELDRLAQSLAERDADLVAAEWTIGELRQRLAARPS